MPEQVTITLHIGNSDDKLSQSEWAGFVSRTAAIVTDFARHVHFFGGAATYEPWQNVAWIFTCEPDNLTALKDQLRGQRVQYNQDRVGITVGSTEFV